MRRRLLPVLVFVGAGFLASCGSSASDGAVDGADRPVTTTAPRETTLLETAPVTLPAGERPAEVPAGSTGYVVAGTGGVWVAPNGDAVVVDCSAADPTPAIRAAGIPGYRGIATCI